MVINRAKSGIMVFDWQRAGRGLGTAAEAIRGFPVIAEYKYLGGKITRKFKVGEHLTHIERKVGFVTSKLSPIRLLKDLRLSVNLFRTFVMPLVRMGLMNALATNPTDKEAFMKRVRMRFKTFCLLPRSTPNWLIRMLLGSIADIGASIALRATKHLAKDGLIAEGY